MSPAAKTCPVARAQARVARRRRCRPRGPARSASAVRGIAPSPTTSRSASSARAVGEHDALDASRALHSASTRDAGADVDAVLAVERRRRSRRPRGPSAASSGVAAELDDRDLEPLLARRGRHLHADPAAAGDHRTRRPAASAAASASASARCAGGGRRRARRPAPQPARLRAGGEQQPVVAEPLAADERDARARAVSIAVTAVPVRSSMSCSA